jgi:hypothetical protein
MENRSSLREFFSSAAGGEFFHKIGISRFYENYISLRPLRRCGEKVFNKPIVLRMIFVPAGDRNKNIQSIL